MFTSTIILFICSIVSKVLGFVRELAVAYKYGASAISDAFIITNNIPTIFFAALSAAISINYIPVAVGIKEEEGERDKFTSNLINICFIILAVGIVIMLFFPDAVLKILAAGMNDGTKGYALVMMNITVFAAIPMILSAIFQSYLQIYNRFLLTGIMSIIINVIVILFTQISTSDTFYLLSAGTLISNMVAMIILWIGSRRLNYRHRFTVNFTDPNIKQLVFLTAPLLLETIASSVNTLVDKNMASFLDTGTVTGLNYAGNLSNMAYTMVVTSIITVVFPKFSKYASEKKLDFLKREFKIYDDALIMLLLPIGVFMCYMAYPIVKVLFMRGAFDASAAKITAESMTFYSLGLLPAGMQTYVIRVFYSLKDTKTPTLYAVLALGVNIFLNFMLVGVLKHRGLALATTLARTLSYGLLLYRLRIKIGLSYREMGLINLVKSGIAAVCAVLVSRVTFIWKSDINDFLYLILTGIIYLTVYFILLLILRYDLLSKIFIKEHRQKK